MYPHDNFQFKLSLLVPITVNEYVLKSRAAI